MFRNMLAPHGWPNASVTAELGDTWQHGNENHHRRNPLTDSENGGVTTGAICLKSFAETYRAATSQPHTSGIVVRATRQPCWKRTLTPLTDNNQQITFKEFRRCWLTKTLANQNVDYMKMCYGSQNVGATRVAKCGGDTENRQLATW